MLVRTVGCRDGECVVWSREPVQGLLIRFGEWVGGRYSGLFFMVRNRYKYGYCSWGGVSSRCRGLRSYRKMVLEGFR